jgi:hypothetical protein
MVSGTIQVASAHEHHGSGKMGEPFGNLDEGYRQKKAFTQNALNPV